MIKKILSSAIIPILGLVILLIGIYFLDQRFNFGLMDSVNKALSSLSKQGGSEDSYSTETLEIELKNTNVITLDSSSSLTLKSNKDINLENNDKFKLIYIQDSDGFKYYVLEIFNIGIGTAPLNVKFLDNDGNSKEVTLSVTRENYTLPYGLKEIPDWEGSVYSIDGDNLLVSVDKLHKLVEDYVPTDLVDLNKDKLLYTNASNIRLRSEAADYLQLMLKDLQEEKDKIVVIASGFRSIIDQYRQYASWVRELGQEEADKISARPGYSEHSLGTVVDFMSQDSGFSFTNNFDQTVAGKWLKENAHKYGYVQSYPESMQEQTGYNYESWHYRYIGPENAIKFKESGQTLNEWLVNN